MLRVADSIMQMEETLFCFKVEIPEKFLHLKNSSAGEAKERKTINLNCSIIIFK